MKLFLKEIKRRYLDRYIIVDSPSVGDFSADTRIIAELCDFVVLVVPYGKVTDSEIRASIEILGQHRIAGVVFNNV
jgi:protein-tyrosine kinase